MRKGYILTVDAIIALAVFVIFSVWFISSQSVFKDTNAESFKKLHYLSEDTMSVLNAKGVLDQICTEWVLASGDENSDHWNNARLIARQYLSAIVPENTGYSLLIEGKSICNDSRETPQSDASVWTHSSRILSGYMPGVPARGYVARAYLAQVSSGRSSKYAYFGGYVGDGNITLKVLLPADAKPTGAHIEVNAGNAFNLYVNGKSCGSHNPVTAGMRVNVDADLPCFAEFMGGENVVNVNYTSPGNNSIGGGYIRVDYSTADLGASSDVDPYWLPGIKGAINLYSSFYVPGDINSMRIFLHYNSNASQFMTIGNATVFLGNDTGEQSRLITSDDIESNLTRAGLSYDAISEKTVPIRFGTSGFSGSGGSITGNADVVLTTDTSFSMWHTTTMEGAWHRVSRWQVCPPGCASDCWVSYGCDGRFSCTIPCYACDASYCGEAKTPNPIYAGTYCWDCLSRNCRLTEEIDEDTTVSLISCKDPYNYYYFGINGTATGCNFYPCFNSNRASCGGPWWVNCDREYVNDHTVYAADGLPEMVNLRSMCDIVCWRSDLTGLGLAQQLDQDFIDDVLSASGNKVGLVSYATGIRSTRALSDNSAALKNQVMTYKASGETCICCAIREAAGILSGGDPSQNRYMLLMSDGEANERCNDPWRASGDENGDGLINAKDDAIYAASKAHNETGVTIYSVGFGSKAGTGTLQRIAALGGGSFYESNEADELRDIYQDIAETIASGSVTVNYSAQTILNAISNSVLYPDSYIQFDYTPKNPGIGYGEVAINMESRAFGNSLTTGNFTVPDNTKVIDAAVTSYSAQYWTKHLDVTDSAGSSKTVYDLNYYGGNYTLLGDPYKVDVPAYLLGVGLNNVTIFTGESQSSNTGGSPDDKAIYTVLIKTGVGYGEPLEQTEGCVWTVEFYDLSTQTIKIPYDYAGGWSCSYTSAGISYSNQSAVSDAAYRLFRQLDVSPTDGRLDVKFDPEHMKTESTIVGGVRSLWGPLEVKLVLWMK